MDVTHKAFTEALESLSYLTEVDMVALARLPEYAKLFQRVKKSLGSK